MKWDQQAWKFSISDCVGELRGDPIIEVLGADNPSLVTAVRGNPSRKERKERSYRTGFHDDQTWRGNNCRTKIALRLGAAQKRLLKQHERNLCTRRHPFPPGSFPASGFLLCRTECACGSCHSASSSNRFLSPGVDAGDYLYISGQGPPHQLYRTIRTDAPIPATLDNVKAVVESRDDSRKRCVCQVYLTHIGSYPEMNRVFGEYFRRLRQLERSSGCPSYPPVQINAVAVRNLDGRAVHPANSSKDESASPGILTHDRLFIPVWRGPIHNWQSSR